MLASYILIFACLWLGGVLKGATGVGAPIIAVPVITALFDVRLAVVVMVLPNLINNAWQFWKFRKSANWSGFVVPLIIGGATGVALGTWLLKALPENALVVLVASAVFIYICVRVFNNEWRLSSSTGRLLGLPAGIASGILQGSIGISAPISLSYLNSMRLERPVFISSASLLFMSFGLVQLPALILADFMTTHGAIMSLLAVGAIAAGMPVGTFVGQRFQRETFDKIILFLLSALTIRLLFEAW